MATTASTIALKASCLEFAATHGTPAVREAIRYAEAGAITWEQAYGLFQKALGAALAEVA